MAMACCIRGRSLFLLMLLSVLKRGDMQIICRIEVDSASGWWRDVTPAVVSANEAATYCDGFLYRETNLTCTTPLCHTDMVVNGNCILYSNVMNQGPCLASCKKDCHHGYQCDAAPANCPCQENHARYKRTRMCVAVARFKNCTNGEINEKNKCIPTSCIDACPNGRCSEEGKCSCLAGFGPAPNSGKCVPTECLNACVNGTCDLSGDCTCHDGYEKEASERYKCKKKIDDEDTGGHRGSTPDVCADVECGNGTCENGDCMCREGFQKDPGGKKCSPTNGPPREGREFGDKSGCDRYGCTETNGWCVQGRCQCKDGFRNDPRNEYKCVRIECPSSDATFYCQRVCQSYGCTGPNGWCVTTGECQCTVGFKKDPTDKYKCSKISCPDWAHEAHCQNECLKSGCRGTNGRCEQGDCRCSEGFKKSFSPFECEPISCPDSGEAAHCKDVCVGKCKNGWCTEDGVCVCNQGFKADPSDKYVCSLIDCQSVWDEAICSARCNSFCTNGSCDYRGACKCTEGFKKGRGLYQCNKISCPSPDVLDNGYCKTLCENACVNGKCNAKGYCECSEGFKKSSVAYECVSIMCPDSGESGYCKAECRKLCKNGRCSDDGDCQCDDGYKKAINQNYVCNRINCPSNEHEDYGYCKTQCDANCKNGVCGNNGYCSCGDGFKKALNTDYKCDNINCASEGEIYRGYCAAQCTRYCHNGDCINGVRCECKSGFRKTHGKRYECKAINCPASESVDYNYCKTQCTGVCMHGVCDYRGACKCITGFKKSPQNIYHCDNINCPSEGDDDKTYCTSECRKYCHNGTCDNGGKCECNGGFKKERFQPYKCNQIDCPSSVPEDNVYCKYQCEGRCKTGTCDEEGNCKCNAGFMNPPNELYTCVEINCPSTDAKNASEMTFCKSVCTKECAGGLCNDHGFCNCYEGFKKIPDEHYNCAKIKCPTSKPEDKVYCKGRCSKTCTNGDCDERGACVCQEAFVPTSRWKEDCRHECHDDDSCSLEAILGGVIGGGFAVVVAIIVAAALVIRNRNREERAKKELEAQEVPLETLSEEPEYVNYGQEAEAEENDMYQAFDHNHPGRGRLQ